MAVLALVLLFAWLSLVFALRTYLHYRRTGAIPVPVSDRWGSPQWWAKLVSGLGVLCAVAAPIAELTGLPPIGMLDVSLVRFAGVGLILLGILGTVVAQSAMGGSWRADVDPDARTPLVTTGPFRLVRNPVLTCTVVTVLGLALIVPNVVAALMLAAVVTAIQIQVRLVEEPYLLRVHGDDYRRYAARTGRFLPWIGRLSDHGPAPRA